MNFNAQQLSFLTCKLAPFIPPGTFVSPCSVHLALALVGAGATGPTLGELQKTLGWPTGLKWQEKLAQLLSSLRAATAAGEPKERKAHGTYLLTFTKKGSALPPRS